MKKGVTRRDALVLLAGTAGAACSERKKKAEGGVVNQGMQSDDVVLELKPLGFPWPTPDPFLFCVHHDDRYPNGNDQLGPAASLAGRDLGQDFGRKDGWSMYHGDVVPGFPQHPHRGFETVTVVRHGLLDHSDSMGATARYGRGDVQWLTAGKGILHAEMFPLLKPDAPNPVELFQIWLNLPKADKLAEPHFTMLWDEQVPRHRVQDAAGKTVEVTVVAGRLADVKPGAPPPKSWAARADSDVAIWTVKLPAGAQWTLPAAQPGSNRWLYYFQGGGLKVGGQEVPARHAVVVRAERAASLDNRRGEDAELLVLQGRPIREPVVQHGPFVMTSREEIVQTFSEYQRTQFGGWPWKRNDPVHPREEGRFARHADGRTERPG